MEKFIEFEIVPDLLPVVPSSFLEVSVILYINTYTKYQTKQKRRVLKSF